ncbi:hypothetical protein FH972_019802 [Carpinus fangiana]|uniref:Uncharacterized protein n=1 Tax=Carpinus fangiana TaxID=176857 RepID=A0A5N6RUS7_9ROSI|nr:hypothetical protein FH972_019802 [Carpinus fangiana]
MANLAASHQPSQPLSFFTSPSIGDVSQAIPGDSKRTGTEARYSAFLNARESRKGKPFNRLGSVSVPIFGGLSDGPFLFSISDSSLEVLEQHTLEQEDASPYATTSTGNVESYRKEIEKLNKWSKEKGSPSQAPVPK